LNSESTRTQVAAPDQERLARILDEYLVAIEQGHGVTPEELLARHPEDAGQLRGYLSGLNLFHAVAVAPAQTLGGAAPSDIGIPPALRTIGDYRLVREIGRGGMGVVYEAFQVSLRRRVALKVLPFTSAHDAKQIGRFKNEAQAAAQVQHPNIVPVFAIGAENGVHFYVMQLIEGQSLTGLLNGLRTGEAGPCDTTLPNNGLTLNNQRPSAHPESAGRKSGVMEPFAPLRAGETADHVRVVARMGIQAAEALHAAHEYGIVHRDVKPSNLLLDDQGKIWVTDFGLAQCRENPGFTQTGDVLGTMRYMSPEQALGRAALVDQRTDVYSLGLTMYELSTLNHPADENGEFQVFDPNRPAPKPLRHWNRHIPHDFQTIVLKCMAEFPQERYTTAKELAEDLECFLDGRPILASPPSLLSRAGKWTKRHRGVVYATAAVLAVALLGFGVNFAMVSRERIAANEREVLQTHDSMRRMGGVLNSFTSSQWADELAAIPGAEGVRQELLQIALDYFQQYEDLAAHDANFAADAAIAKSKLGALYEKMGKPAQALEAHAQATKAWEALLDRDPNNIEFSRNLANSLNNLGWLSAEDGRSAEALSLLTRASELLKPQAGSPDSAADLATTYNNLGLVLKQMQAQDSAAADFQSAIDLQESLLKTGNADKAVLRTLAASYNNLASLQEASDPKAADQSYDKAVALQMKLVIADPINRTHQADLARTYNNRGFLASRNKDWTGAELWYGDAIRLQENLVKESPLAGSYRRDLAISYNNLGMAQSRGNHLTEAQASFEKAARSQDMLLVADPNDAQTLSNQGGVWNNLGMLYDRQHKPAEAATAYQQAIHFQTAALKQADKNDSYRSTLSRHYFNYARNLATQEKYAEALAQLCDLRALWTGKPDRLYSVAKEMAKLDRQMAEKTGLEQLKTDCTQAAIATLREALDGGLSKDRLSDASLASLANSPEFRQLTGRAEPKLIAPADAPSAEINRVN
jgi:hypothetical protein